MLAQQVFALIAIPSTLIMLIQTVMLLIGLGGEGDVDGDVDGDEAFEGGGDGLVLFSVRGVVSTLTVMGWSAVALLETLAPAPAIIIAAVLGGTSLFGGKGSTFPCALIGALIMSCISNALVLVGAAPNAYNVVYACVIFLVVLIDTPKAKFSH
jgi:hypothetical protein